MGSTWEEQKQYLIKKEGYPPQYLEKYEKSIAYGTEAQTVEPTVGGFFSFVEPEYPGEETIIGQDHNPKAALSLDSNSKHPHLTPETPETFGSIANQYEQLINDSILLNFHLIERLGTEFEELKILIAKGAAETPEDFFKKDSDANRTVQELLKYLFCRGCEELKLVDKNSVTKDQRELNYSNFLIPRQGGLIALNQKLTQVWAFAAYRAAEFLDQTIHEKTDNYDLIVQEFKAKLLTGEGNISGWIKELSIDQRETIRKKIDAALQRDNPPTATTPSTPSESPSYSEAEIRLVQGMSELSGMGY